MLPYKLQKLNRQMNFESIILYSCLQALLDMEKKESLVMRLYLLWFKYWGRALVNKSSKQSNFVKGP